MSGFVSLQELIYPEIVRNFYTAMRIKEKVGKISLVSTVKGVKIKITQGTLSKALRIHNEGNELFFSILVSCSSNHSC
jgi:hypothetical protein